jgi:hypothetical protein
MPSYDDDLPTPQEETLLKELVNANDLAPRRDLLTQVNRVHCLIDRWMQRGLLLILAEKLGDWFEPIKNGILSRGST